MRDPGCSLYKLMFALGRDRPTPWSIRDGAMGRLAKDLHPQGDQGDHDGNYHVTAYPYGLDQSIERISTPGSLFKDGTDKESVEGKREQYRRKKGEHCHA